jgi:hypothetical protein
MLHLLKIEWLKLKNYRTFWILSALFIISIFGINYIAYQIHLEIQREQPMTKAIMGGPFDFPMVWHTMSYFSSFLMFIPGLLMIISITNEFSYKTHRQNVIDGLSRTQFVTVKMVLAVLLALGCTITVFLTTLFFGLAASETPLDFGQAKAVLYYFVQALSYSGLALLFGLLFRRSGIAIGVFFLYQLILDELLAALLKRYVGKIGYFMPLETNDVLIPAPFGNNIAQRYLNRPDVTALLIGAAAYLLLYFFLSKRKFETADL